MQTAPTSGSRAAWPLAAICCLGLILFLIAATIVLALIPVYLTTKDVARSADDDRSTDPVYASFDAEVDDDDDLVPGEGRDLDSTKSAFTSSNDVQFTGLSADNTAAARRKRGWYGERQKRTIIVVIIIEIRFVATQCNAKCLRDRKEFRTNLQKSDSRSCDISIDGGPLGNVTKKAMKLKFKSLVRAKPSDFRPRPTSDTFTCIKDGDFNDRSIWAGGFLPAGKCKIIIPAGRKVTISRESFRVKATLITVAGTLVLGSGSSTFTFRHPINIRVLKDGKIEDATSSKRILVARGSVIYAFTGATFCQAGTVIQSFSPAGNGDSFTIIKPTGPLTIAVLVSGALLTFNKIAFVAITSGGLTSGGTYMGGIGPSIADCTDSPCAVIVLAGVTVNTADLNGVLDINIDEFTILQGAMLELGTAGSANGFKFKFPVQLNIVGAVVFSGSGGGIFLPPGSGFNILAGGSFRSVVATFIQVYNPLTGANIGVATVLGLSFGGPYFVTISITGLVTVGTTPPGGVIIVIPVVINGTTTTTTTTTTPMVTALMTG